MLRPSPISVLVLGGTGLVGTRVISDLCAAGNRVWATYRRTVPELSASGVSWLPWDGRSQLPSRNLKPDVIIHLANEVRPSPGGSGIGTTGLTTHCLTNAYVLDLLENLRPTNFMWIGTSTGYDPSLDGKEHDFQAGSVPDAHRVVGMTARAFELQLEALARALQVEVCVLRPTTIVGPVPSGREVPRHAIYSTIQQVLDGGRPTIYMPEVARDYVNVSDISRVVSLEASSPREHAGFNAYNIGSGDLVTLREVVRDVCEVLNRPIPVVFEVESAHSPAVSQLPLAKGNERYGPALTSFRAGLSEIVESLLTRRDA